MKNILIYLIVVCSSYWIVGCSNKNIRQAKNEDYQLKFYVDPSTWDNHKLNKTEKIIMSDFNKISKTKAFVRNLFKTAKKYTPPPSSPLPSKIGNTIILYNPGPPLIATYDDDDLDLKIDEGSNENSYIMRLLNEKKCNPSKLISRNQYNELIDFLIKNGNVFIKK